MKLTMTFSLLGPTAPSKSALLSSFFHKTVSISQQWEELWRWISGCTVYGLSANSVLPSLYANGWQVLWGGGYVLETKMYYCYNNNWH